MGLANDAETTDDVRKAVDGARDGDRMGKITVEKNASVTIPGGNALGTNVDPDLFRKYMAEEKEAGRDVKDLKHIERESAAKEVQTKTTTPAAQAKAGGLVEGATITTLGSTVTSPDGQDVEQMRGTADFKIKRDQDGKMTAVLKTNQNQRLVPEEGTAKQEITATLKVDGQPPKQIKFEVAKDGALTEKLAPPATPNGQTKSAEPMR